MIRERLIVLGLLISMANSLSWAYDGGVHETISREAVDASQLDRILKDELGLPDGIETRIKNAVINGRPVQAVWQWIAFGGQAEDYGKKGEDDFWTSRSFNHFHDPLQTWNEAGFDSLLNAIYWYAYGVNPISSVLWALDPGQQEVAIAATGDWSWRKAREYYYIYLVGEDFNGIQVGKTPTQRNSNFADCFRALGQTAHLLQDASVPAHTRNDPHIFPLTKSPLTGQPYVTPIGRWTYETYTSRNAGSLNYAAHFPDPVLLRTPNPEVSYSYLCPTSGLFDRNQYDGNALPANNERVGLAEYTNANFLSEDTMWTYPHPSLEDTNYYTIDWLNPEQVDAEDGKTDNRLYIKKVIGEQIDHLAAADYWSFEYWGLTEALPVAFSLDEMCWKDYAAKLIPRAVGYSAALLDYFFRGKIEISNAQLGYNPAIRMMDSITLLAKNATENGDEMQQGTVDLVLKHRNWYEQEYHHTVTRIAGASSIPRGQSAEVVVYLDEPLPIESAEVKAFLVFKGRLGQENGGIGVGFTEVITTLVNEEWDNGLAGNHSWQHMSGGHEYGSGVTANVVSNGILFKSNLRYVGRSGACYNESYLSLADGGNPQGILVRPDTFIHFRIPRMNVQGVLPEEPGETADWQALNLLFNSGYQIQFSRPGQMIYYSPKTGHYYFDPSLMIFENIYDLFEEAGISVPEPLYLEAIDLIQQLFDLEEPSTIAHHQEMEMDFIRVIGRK